MSRIGAYGISVELPRGWDAAVYRRSPEARGPLQIDEDGGETHPVAHIASFPLPPVRGDYGSGAVERMAARDVLVCLLEFAPELGRTEQFSVQGVPRFRANDFDPAAMQRTVHGLCGAQTFFNESGRAFAVYVVLGSWRARGNLVGSVNEVLGRLRIEPTGR